MADDRKLIDQIPIEVRDYLTAGDGLAAAAVQEQYPNVEKTLHAASTRVALVQYLGSKAPWGDPPSLTLGALSFLQTNATAKEAAILRPLVRHRNAWVRLRVHEYMMDLYYPARDQAAMTALFEEMLADPDEVVRVQAARWIKGLNMGGDMRTFLQHWVTLAAARKWDQQESFGMIKDLLR